MDELQQVGQDLRYVRSAVERAETHHTPRLLCFLWAVVGGVGFALVDLSPAWVSAYWTVAGPAGFLVSAWLGWRDGRARGHVSAREGLRHVLHWGAMLAAIFLVLLLPSRGVVPWSGTGPTILLILALGYFQAGVHFDAALRWVGLLLGAGYVFVLFVSAYAWVSVGVLFALALVAVGVRASRHAAAG